MSNLKLLKFKKVMYVELSYFASFSELVVYALCC